MLNKAFTRFATFFGATVMLTVLSVACSPNASNSTKSSNTAPTNNHRIVGPYSVQLTEGTVTNLRYHLTLPAHSPYRSLSNVSPLVRRVRIKNATAAGASFYPGDLANDAGGPVVDSAISHNIYVNCQASCWGNPEQFLRDLGDSSFIQLADQYVGVNTSKRYTVGASETVNHTIYQGSLDSNEILAIVDDASKKFGSGYHVIYHIFLPKDVDTCISGTTQCYSPDNTSNWQFCAYHVSGDFPGNRHVLYTVEPYQYLDTCAAAGSTGGSPLENSTDSSLSHELFETITDPDSGSWLAVAQAVKGQEIGDLCAGQQYPVRLGTRVYSIQLEYSDAVHGCSDTPQQ